MVSRFKGIRCCERKGVNSATEGLSPQGQVLPGRAGCVCVAAAQGSGAAAGFQTVPVSSVC